MLGMSWRELRNVVLSEIVIGIPLAALVSWVYNRYVDNETIRDVGLITIWPIAIVAVLLLATRPALSFSLSRKHPPSVPIDQTTNVFLELREHCGVKWRPQVLARGTRTIINGPYCPEDDERLVHRSADCSR